MVSILAVKTISIVTVKRWKKDLRNEHKSNDRPEALPPAPFLYLSKAMKADR